MDIFFGTTQVPTAGTAVQISNTAENVKKIKFKTRFGNTGAMYVGKSTVTATAFGWMLEIPVAARPIAETDWIDFGENGAVKLNVFYANAAVDNERVDWIAITR